MSVTVGYRYYLGMHMVLCHGPVDRVSRIQVDERTAWQGPDQTETGRIRIMARGLFGGESREGGIDGDVDIEMGGAAQIPNDYLQKKIGTQIPAYRGVVAAVLRRPYLGINPYLKKWAFRATRTKIRQNGIPQWYREKAEIAKLTAEVPSNSRLYLSLDRSGSMLDEDKIETLKTAMYVALNALEEIVAAGAVGIDLRIVAFNNTPSTITRTNLSLSDFPSLRSFVDGLTASGGTDAQAAYGGALDFFDPEEPNNNVLVCVSDGEMTNVEEALEDGIRDFVNDQTEPFSVEAGTAVAVRGVGIETLGSLDSFDNSIEGVPVVSGMDPQELADVILNALSGKFYPLQNRMMNPAHIIRECLTDPDWGMGYQDADIDDASFEAAADRLYDEKMGMSLLWDRQIPIEGFIGEIVKHIDGAVYVDRRTGLFKLKLIRDDFDPDEIPSLDESNVEKIETLSRPTFGELVNSVTVNYWNAATGKDASVTVQDTAMVQMQGAVINTTVQYPGFTEFDLAQRVAMRDLRALSTPLVTCTIRCNSIGRDLDIGDTFKLSWADYGLENVVMRVTGLNLGDGRKNAVRITATQDVFALPETVVMAPPEDAWVDPVQPPQPSPARAVIEAPYYELVRQFGQTAVDTALDENPEIGYLLLAAAAPPSAINAETSIDRGAGFVDGPSLDFCPSATTTNYLGLMDTTIEYGDEDRIDEVGIGDFFQVGQELMSVEAIDTDAQTISVKRGILDTIPQIHEIGSLLMFWGIFSSLDATIYVDGEEPSAKILPTTGKGTLAPGGAPTDTVTIIGRAARPYPPANIQLNGQYFPLDQIFGDLLLTWSHRNRLQQTGGTFLGWTDGSTSPEPGATYRVVVEDQSFAVVYEQGGITSASHLVAEGDLPKTSEWGWVTIYAERDGIQSALNLRVRFFIAEAGGGDDLEFVMDETIDPPAGDELEFIL